MVKGKKKASKKGKKNGKNAREGADVGDSHTLHISPERKERARLATTMSGSQSLYATYQPTEQQKERAIEAAVNRTEDPLKNWTRLQNEECPICMLPLPFESSITKHCVTCDKSVCVGCMMTTAQVHRRDGGDVKTAEEKVTTCPFCRSSTAVYDDKLRLEKEMKRANAGNGESMYRVGNYYYMGEMGLQQDKAEGLKWYHRAVGEGSGEAAFCLGRCYCEGDMVLRDHDRALEYFQKSADLGFIPSFRLVGIILMKKGNIEEAMLNLRKAVMCGYCNDDIFNELRNGFKLGFITKEEYAFTLRENQKACNEMKSDGREEIKKMLSEGVELKSDRRERWKRHNISR